MLAIAESLVALLSAGQGCPVDSDFGGVESGRSKRTVVTCVGVIKLDIIFTTINAIST